MQPKGLLPACFCLAISCLLAGDARAQDSTKLVFTVQPSTMKAGVKISPAVQVAARDEEGETDPDFTGNVTLTITTGTGTGGASLAGTKTVAAVAGVATFSDLGIDSAGSGYTLSATATGLVGGTSAPFDITLALAPQLVFSVQPSTAKADSTISPAVQVTARDTAGQTDTSFTGEVTLAITPGTDTTEAELGGTTTVTAVAGVATFATLTIDNAGNGYTLTATASGRAGATSAPFAISAGEEQGTASGEDEPIPAGERVTLHATAQSNGSSGSNGSDHSFTLDGRLEDAAWSGADSIVNLITIEPEEGGVPAGQTIVKVLVNPTELLIGVLCRDANPAGIVSFSRARDADLESEDHVLIVLDPFQDGRSGYVFAVNPSGARFDGLVIAQGEEVNSDWDAVWEAKTSRDRSGWSAEIRIPIRSLSFKKGLTGWGFNVQRRVQRLQETSRWSGASRDYEIYQTSRAGLLTELPEFDFGLGLSIRPALVASTARPDPGSPREQSGDLSVDITKKLGSNLVASATVNTDFAETETDARQTNLTRFDVLFPEKRSFFLEGSDIFEFGLGLDEANLLPFFSRRIGLVSPEEGESEKIPIILGTKLNGRVGNTSLGTLVTRTGSLELDSLGVPGTTMGVVRIKQNVLEESSIGAIATFGDPLGRSGSWLAGVDATYRTTQFLGGEKSFLIGVWGMRNNRDDLDGDKNAYGFRIDYPNDLVAFGATSITIGDAVQPSLGFAPRTGVRLWEAGIDFNPRPSWGLVRQMFHEVGVTLFTDLSNTWESYEAKINPLDWLLESGDRITVKVLPQGDRPPEDFEIFEGPDTGVFIPAGSYEWTRYSVTGTLAEKRMISGELIYEFGRFYDGHLKTIEGTLALKPWSVLSVEVSAERNQAELPGGDFTQFLYSIRAEVKPSADLQVSSFLQYDNESHSFGTNTRLRWTFNPLGDLFVVLNHNLLRNLNDRFMFDSNQLLVKLQYALRR